MASSNLIRLGGLVAMVSGVLYVVLGLAIVPVMLLRRSPVLPESCNISSGPYSSCC